MLVKTVFGILGVALVAAYVLPIVLKLKDMSLSIVVMFGLALALIDMLQSLRAGD
jgi:hypothetical protein